MNKSQQPYPYSKVIKFEFYVIKGNIAILKNYQIDIYINTFCPINK